MFSCTQISKLVKEKKVTGNELAFEKQKIVELLCLCCSSQGPDVLRVFCLILNAKPAWQWRRHSCTITPHGLKPCRDLAKWCQSPGTLGTRELVGDGFYQDAADHTESSHRTGVCSWQQKEDNPEKSEW